MLTCAAPDDVTRRSTATIAGEHPTRRTSPCMAADAYLRIHEEASRWAQSLVKTISIAIRRAQSEIASNQSSCFQDGGVRGIKVGWSCLWRCTSCLGTSLNNSTDIGTWRLVTQRQNVTDHPSPLRTSFAPRTMESPREPRRSALIDLV